jgi:outer membrane protein assembly factor BamC
LGPQALAETMNLNSALPVTPDRPAPAPAAALDAGRRAGVSPGRTTALALAVLLAFPLAGCSSLSEFLGGDKADYKAAGAKTKPLEVPPDLSQLARDSRFLVQSGTVSASGAAAAAGANTAVSAASPAVAPAASGGVRVERVGQQRWLTVAATPEQVWPVVRAFWEQKGFTLAVDDAKTGIIETNWSENRTKLPTDLVRNVLGRFLGNAFDTGERDRFRTRVERTASGSEIYVSHRAIEEVYTNDQKDATRWRARPSDPQLEADFLSQLMLALGAKDESQRPTAVATVKNAPESPARARTLTAGGTALEIDDPFDRAWRRVGLALDRGGFTVEDRDRSAGLYYVRYVDPRSAGLEEPGFWAKLFGDGKNPQAAVRYRVALKSAGDKTTVSVLTSAGGPEVGENGQRIASLLVNELR